MASAVIHQKRHNGAPRSLGKGIQIKQVGHCMKAELYNEYPYSNDAGAYDVGLRNRERHKTISVFSYQILNFQGI